jgi:hypothetical protein
MDCTSSSQDSGLNPLKFGRAGFNRRCDGEIANDISGIACMPFRWDPSHVSCPRRHWTVAHASVSSRESLNIRQFLPMADGYNGML